VTFARRLDRWNTRLNGIGLRQTTLRIVFADYSENRSFFLENWSGKSLTLPGTCLIVHGNVFVVVFSASIAKEPKYAQ